MEEKFNLNYIKCPNCNNTLDTSFINKTCPNPLCIFNFKGLDKLLKENDDRLKRSLVEAQKAGREIEKKLIITAVKFNMGNYLAHFIACNWYNHCHALFIRFIRPHLDDLNVLKLVLSSDVITLNKDAIISKNGYKMYWELYKYLIRVRDEKIKKFLRREFRRYELRHNREISNKIAKRR